MNIQDLLRSRYPAVANAVLFEVRNAAGFSATRACDAIAIGLWPSRGLKVVGFEIKASRADWLRELRAPEKADAFMQWCDEWYVVADGKDIVHADEVPETWGWLQRNGNRLTCEKPAQALAAQPIGRGALASLLKRAIEQGAKPAQAEYERGFLEGKKAVTDSRETHAAHLKERFDKLNGQVQAFEKASGVRIDYYEAGKIGEAVRMVMRGDRFASREHVTSLLTQAQAVVVNLEKLNQQIAELEAQRPQPATP